MESTFLGLVEKANELGVSESALRASALSFKNEFGCYGFISYDSAYGSQEQFLPFNDEDEFPHSEWNDYGSSIDQHSRTGGTKNSTPRYTLNGWFRLSRPVFQKLLSGQDVNLHEFHVWAFDSSLTPICPLEIEGKSVWVQDKNNYGEPDGGHNEQIATILKPSDCYFLSKAAIQASKGSVNFDVSSAEASDHVHPRTRNNMLGLIKVLASMAGLSMTEPYASVDAINAEAKRLGVSLKGKTGGDLLKAAFGDKAA